SNSHALCPQARNLTDPQLKAIRESKGMVGVKKVLAMYPDLNHSIAQYAHHV
ncbi:membrane dipeptidase, partial [Acinetobacter sp. 11520]|nr:membrane dipeptidase [Acinetobacter sp. 11520]